MNKFANEIANEELEDRSIYTKMRMRNRALKLLREVERYKYCEQARTRIERHGIQPVLMDERKWSGYLMNSEGKIIREKRAVTEQIAMMIENGEFGDIW